MKRYESRVTNAVGKTRLDDFLAQWLSSATGRSLPRRVLRQLVVAGSVYVNRHRVNSTSVPLFPGAFIEVYWDDEKIDRLLAGKVVSSKELTEDHIVYEDEWLVAISKPAGMPSQQTVDGSRTNAFQSLKKLIFERSKGREIYLGMHHRLDRDTSGIVLFTKKEEANKGIADLFQHHRIRKVYQALSLRVPGAEKKFKRDSLTVVKSYIKRLSGSNEPGRFGSVSSGGDPSETHIKIQDELKHSISWLQAEPQTGRTHQIRVHLSENGYPILGDQMYFPKDVASLVQVPRMMLHSNILEFEHPITKVQVQIEAPFYPDFFQVLTDLGGEI